MINESTLPTAHVCKLLGTHRSSFYLWQKRAPSTNSDGTLRQSMHVIAQEFPGYGYRRITVELHRRKITVNHKKVLRLMHEEKILCKRKSFKPKTTNSNHGLPLYPNIVRDIVVTRPNQIWVSDITYIHLEEGFVYLASILDIFGRKCVGWAMSRRIDAQLALTALESAIAQRAIFGLNGLIHHSDRGVQYASHLYVECLAKHGILISMTQTGNPRENAFAESFFKTLKVEEVYLKDYKTFEDAYHNIQQSIEDVYNAKRIHSSIGYKTPNEMEAEVLNIR